MQITFICCGQKFGGQPHVYAFNFTPDTRVRRRHRYNFTRSVLATGSQNQCIFTCSRAQMNSDVQDCEIPCGHCRPVLRVLWTQGAHRGSAQFEWSLTLKIVFVQPPPTTLVPPVCGGSWGLEKKLRWSIPAARGSFPETNDSESMRHFSK